MKSEEGVSYRLRSALKLSECLYGDWVLTQLQVCLYTDRVRWDQVTTLVGANTAGTGSDAKRQLTGIPKKELP